MARQVIDVVLAGEGTPEQVAHARGLEMVSDDGALAEAVDAVIAANPDVAAKVRDGKVAAAGALIGQVMKQMKGQADAAKVRALILERLGA
jgi:aspartyl-tRNA(Asn)/glutamyl-tRNA(Gln) amidotransferase subunit B